MDTQSQAQGASALAGYVTLSSWADVNRGPVFSNKSSVEWFVKRHRVELIEAGALIPRGGRVGSLVSLELFPRVVLQILKRRALQEGRSINLARPCIPAIHAGN